MSNNIQLNTIEEAIEDIRQGKVIIVVDDEDRENEGDFLAAAEKVTPEMINFMATHGRGLICAPLTESRCKELDLHAMVRNNTDHMETAFTVSVDLKGNGVSTGISAADRAKTIQALIDPETKPFDLARPGHIFPLIAKQGGVLRRTGHTEAAIDFARLAGFKPAGVIVEIMNEDGTMARLPQLVEVAKKFDLKLVSIEALVAYRMQHDSLIQKKEDFDIQTRFGTFRMRAYLQTTNKQVHIALTKGTWNAGEPVLTRINTTQVNNDILGNDMIIDGNNFLIAGYKDGEKTFRMLNQTGNLIWEKSYDLPSAYSISKLTDGNYISIGGANYGFSENSLLKFNENGEEIWNKNYRGFNVLAISNNEFLALTYDDNDSGNLVRFNESGDAIWTTQLPNFRTEVNKPSPMNIINYDMEYFVCTYLDINLNLKIIVINQNGNIINTRTINRLTREFKLVTKTIDNGMLIVYSGYSSFSSIFGLIKLSNDFLFN